MLKDTEDVIIEVANELTFELIRTYRTMSVELVIRRIDTIFKLLSLIRIDKKETIINDCNHIMRDIVKSSLETNESVREY